MMTNAGGEKFLVKVRWKEGTGEDYLMMRNALHAVRSDDDSTSWAETQARFWNTKQGFIWWNAENREKKEEISSYTETIFATLWFPIILGMLENC